MKREYYIRGQKVAVEEIPGILAVRLEAKPEMSLSKAAEQFGRLATSRAKKGESRFDMPDEEQKAFNNAGWLFIRPSDEVVRAAKVREAPVGATFVGSAFRQSDGHILIGTDRLTVQLKPELSKTEVESTLKKNGLELVNELKFAPYQYEVRVAAGLDPLDTAKDLHKHPKFVFAEPQMIEYISVRFTPTDPDYDKQWQWNNDGTGGGTAGADVDAEAAWDFTRGAGVRIAVIDTGIEVDHDDLVGGLAAATGYFEDDGMGGANFVVGTTDFPGGNHGTFCSGIAAARANNSEDGCGMANQSGLIPIACLGDQVGTQATLARAVAYAANPTNEAAAVAAGLTAADGADVLSCSLGPNGADWTMQTVMQNAIDAAVTNGRGGLGMPIFWAVTNGDFTLDGSDGTDEVVSYGNVIAVGRSTRNDTHDNTGHGPELDFLAPGADVQSTRSGNSFGSGTGTSYAAPCAAGIGALMLSVNPDLTWTDVRQIIRDTCDKVGGVAYGADDHHDRYGFGRVNAARAVCAAGFIHELQTPSLTFNDIPEGETTVRAVVFEVQSCRAVTFQITSGPTVISGPAGTSFATPLGVTVSLAATGDFSTLRYARLWISYTGTSDGDIASGTVTVRCLETEEQWDIPITANTVARESVAVVLALDKSNSMTFDSGIPGQKRIDVLHFSVPPFVDVIQEGNAIGIVSFDQNAYNEMPVTGPLGPANVYDIDRVNAKSKILSHQPNPAGSTSIGDAVELAHNNFAPVTGYDVKATIVFTDGHENQPKYLSEVSGSINERVYAIGLGTADQLKPAALDAMTNGSGGYMLMTGALDTDAYFRVTKYYLQILAGVTNHDIVTDPEGYVAPGQVHRIPFRLNETDISTDIVLLSPAPHLFKFMVETPGGDIIDPGTASTTVGASYVADGNIHYYRMTLPVPVGKSGAGAGPWHVILKVDRKYFDRYLKMLAEHKQEYESAMAHGARYNVSIYAYSNLRMRASLSQSSFEPGATLTVRALLKEYGLPVENRASVWAELIRPDSSTTMVQLKEDEPGVFEAQTVASLSGVYRLRIVGSGSTLRARPFTREQIVTGSVYKGGDDPLPTGKDDPTDQDERLCRFLACLLSANTISPDLEKRLKEMGLNLVSIRQCLKVYCQHLQKPTFTLRPVSENLLTLISAVDPDLSAKVLKVLEEEEGQQNSCCHQD